MNKDKKADKKGVQNPRDMLRQARAYEIFGTFFALAGLLTFIILYVRNIEGRLFEAIANPSTLLMIVMPFLPSVVLTNKAKALRKKALLMLEKKK